MIFSGKPYLDTRGKSSKVDLPLVMRLLSKFNISKNYNKRLDGSPP
jgi:hypothetical protein